MADHPLMAENCIFCKIIAGSIPCARIYEDADILAFLDVNPIAEGHTLVVPKRHYPTLLELPESEGKSLVRALRLVAGAVYSETRADGFNCVQNNFGQAGQTVFHAHWHIIPRFDNDGLSDWPAGKYTDADVMQKLAQALNSRIAATSGGFYE